ncbi:MAG: oligosaccharide flippase family protein [Chlorobi bacterium]|nr:oligosaccharide flippase family protein [Chlorobiota bacterium]
MDAKNTTGKILGNFVSLLSGEIIAKAFGFLTTIYLARTLGPDAFGILGFVWAVYGFFSFVANPGLDMIATRELAAGRYGTTRMVRTVVSLKALLAGGAAVLFILFARIFVQDPVTSRVMMVQALNFLVGIITLDFLYHALQRMKHVAFRRALFGFLYLVLVLWLVRNQDNIALVPVAMFGAGALSLVPQVVIYFRKVRLRSNGDPRFHVGCFCEQPFPSELPRSCCLFMG